MAYQVKAKQAKTIYSWLQSKSRYYILGVVVQSTISVDPAGLTIMEATESRGAQSRQHTFHLG